MACASSVVFRGHPRGECPVQAGRDAACPVVQSIIMAVCCSGWQWCAASTAPQVGGEAIYVSEDYCVSVAAVVPGRLGDRPQSHIATVGQPSTATSIDATQMSDRKSTTSPGL